MKLNELATHPDFQSRTGVSGVPLYYACCRGEALALEANGFNPSKISGKNYLQLFSSPEQALRYLDKDECESIVKVNKAPYSSLMPTSMNINNVENIVDTVNSINKNNSGSVKLVKSLPSAHFEFINKIRKR